LTFFFCYDPLKFKVIKIGPLVTLSCSSLRYTITLLYIVILTSILFIALSATCTLALWHLTRLLQVLMAFVYYYNRVCARKPFAKRDCVWQWKSPVRRFRGGHHGDGVGPYTHTYIIYLCKANGRLPLPVRPFERDAETKQIKS